MNEDKQLSLLKDAMKHDLEILPPDVGVSGYTWQPEGSFGNQLRSGLIQVKGIGHKTATNIIEWRKDKGEFDIGGWYNLMEIKGIGEKTVETIIEFAGAEDPFGIYSMANAIQDAKHFIHSNPRVPMPTHTAAQVPYSRGKDTEVVWLGTIVQRNLRDLFELHFSRTGEELDPRKTKAPHLREWVVMRGKDDTEEDIVVTVDRWHYEKFKEAIWGIKLESDMVLVRGVKLGKQARRALYVNDLWVIGMDDDTEEEDVA